MSSYTKEYLLDLIQQYEDRHGAIPSRRQMRSEFNVTEAPYMRVFGSWEEAKRLYEASKINSADALVLTDDYLNEDKLYGNIIRAQQFQEEIDNILSKYQTFEILVLSDIEIPYANTEMITFAVREAQKRGVKVVVLNGDITHGDFFSKHAKNVHVDPEIEYGQLVKMIQWFSSNFEQVLLVRGNHDDVVERYCQRNLQYECMKFLIKADLLANVSEHFENVHYAHNWWLKVKDTIFAHPSRFTVVPMRTGIGAAGAISKQGIDFNAFVIGHSHQLGSYDSMGATYIETGCSCMDQPYYLNNRATGLKWVRGFATIGFTQGKFDYNKSKLWRWDK